MVLISNDREIAALNSFTRPRLWAKLGILALPAAVLAGCGGQGSDGGGDSCRTLSVLSGIGAMVSSPSYSLAGSMGDGMVAASAAAGSCD
jgi:hypothetical protein